MYPDKTPPVGNPDEKSTGDPKYQQLVTEFVGEVRSQLATLTGEIAARNKVINENDAYIYGDLLSRSIQVPLGHDFTPVNWLHRAVEVHRHQMMGKGFNITSSYHEEDSSMIQDPNEQQMMDLENLKRKVYAEQRRVMCEAILRDNGGFALFAQLAEASSATGDAALKAWYDGKGKYHLELIEATENIYAIWSSDNYRRHNAVGFVHQVSKQDAVRDYGVAPTVATSPLGMPLAILSSANTLNYISTQPMVTIMEITGKIEGWCVENDRVKRCDIGSETELNVQIVGNDIRRLISDVRYLPHYYILPNKRIRRRPWGIPDISKAAIAINQSYIETLSDWRTWSSRVNFPKFKGFGFPAGTQLPKPKPRTVETLPLAPGQDIQELTISSRASDEDFIRQIQELKEEFVREVGISQIMFDNPDVEMNSKQAMTKSMQTISDLVDAKRQLWAPLLADVFTDALLCLGEWDSSIKDLVADTEDWFLRIGFPSNLDVEDPVYQQMLINRLNTNTISLQTFLEKQGETKEELDRIKSELKDKVLGAIHGRQVGLMAELALMPPPASAPPKTTVNFRADLTPEQAANMAAMKGFNNGPVYGPTEGPQGELGIRAFDDKVDQGMISGQPYNTGQPITKDASGEPITVQNNPQLPPGQAQPGAPTVGGQPGGAPGMLSTPGQTPQPASMPGSGATPTSAQGAINKHNQRHGG